MKKLMLIAAIAAVAAVQAEKTTPCVLGPAAKTASVYAWRFVGKTTVGALTSYKIPGAVGSNCQLGGGSTTAACAIRVPASLAIQGYIYYCENCCESFESGTALATDYAFYMTSPFKDVFSSASIDIDVHHIIGKTATQYEAKGTAKFTTTDPSVTYEVWFAGLGSFNKSLMVVSAISGNFAGTAKSPYYIGYVNGVAVSPVTGLSVAARTWACVPADWWKCGNPLSYAGAPDEATVAYGTWTARYNSSASARYRNKGYKVALPAWTGLN